MWIIKFIINFKMIKYYGEKRGREEERELDSKLVFVIKLTTK